MMGLGAKQLSGRQGLVLAGLALIGLSSSAAAHTSSVAAQTSSRAAVLAPGDVVVVSVAGLPDYTTETTVLADGTISGVGFGRVLVSGLHVDQARAAVAAELRKRLKEPAVSLFVKVSAPRFVYVAGVEQTERQFLWRPGLTLRQLLAQVALSDDPDRLEARLLRGGASPVQLDLAGLLAGADAGDEVLVPGDTLSIVRQPYVRVWVAGFVERPGQLRIDRGADLYQAIAAAGGTRLGAAAGTTTLLPSELKVTVRRGPNVSTFSAQPNSQDPYPLEDGDVVSVEVPGLLRVVVGGEVTRPGEVVVRDGTSVESVIAQAGGLRETGLSRNVVVLRGADILKPGSIGGFTLQSGDVVLAKPNVDYVYVMGDVLQAGRYTFGEGEEMNAVNALAKARGLRPTGSNRRAVHVTLGENGRYVARQFNLDEFLKDGRPEGNPTLKPGDLVFFTTPKGINPAQVLQVASALYFFDRIADRN